MLAKVTNFYISPRAPIRDSRGIGAWGPYFARNRDAANLEVHATVPAPGHCGFLAQFMARRGQGLRGWAAVDREN
jgi:hypothetical protein